MSLLEDIRKSSKKPKELARKLAETIKKQKPSTKDFAADLESANPVEKGILIEVLEYVSQEDPKFAQPYLGVVIDHIDFDAPKVKWEASRVIGNTASTFPDEAAKALGKLRSNTTDKGTVVRWSTAFAISEIAKHNQKLQKQLVAEMRKFVEKEENNGVKNVYLKALKIIEKSR